MSSPDVPVRRSGQARQAGGPDAVTVDQTFTEDGLYSLRAAVAAHAGALGADALRVEQLLILASELATNAIRHAGGAGRLRLWRAGDALHLEVSDEGPGLADVTAGTRAPERMAAGGRGLWICRQLTDDLRIVTGPQGTTVTAVLSLNGKDPE
jgi:anti-sigma regulatory factor (Ser/Thr protein kinase)